MRTVTGQYAAIMRPYHSFTWSFTWSFTRLYLEHLMLATSLRLPYSDREIHAESFEIRRGSFRVILGLATLLAVLAMLRAANWRWEPRQFYSWPVALCLCAGLFVAYNLRTSHSRAASWLITTTLALAAALEFVHFPDGPAPYFFSVVVVASAVIHSERGTLLAAALTLSAMIVSAIWLGTPEAADALAWPIMLVLLISIVSWVGIRRLYMVLRWESRSAHQAVQAAREAQSHRAELMHLNKELDGAHARLERMNQMLILARKEAEDARALKMRFANAVSHELRSPLNMILAFSDMMLNSPDLYGMADWPPRLRSHMTQVNSNSQHLSDLIDDVLDMARIDAVRLAMTKEWADLREVAAEAMEIAAGLYEARDLYLRLDAPEALPPVFIDRTRIRQVLLNLLTNAVRFMQAGGVTVHIHVEGDDVIVAAADTGNGMEPDALPGLFREYGATSTGYDAAARSTGLGLALCKELIELHGGRIWAQSTLGQGSTFLLSLPVTASAATPATTQDELFWNQLESNARKDALIVAYLEGGNTHSQRLIGTAVDYFNLMWVQEENALQQAVQSTQPAAVVWLTDQPRHDATHHAQALAETFATPVVWCSAGSLTTDVPPAGLAAYLIKPVTRSKLIGVLNQLGKNLNSVLIIEDDAPMREFLAVAITEAFSGCAITEAGSGQEALAALTLAQPDAILLDMRLPDIHGLELAQHVHTLTGGHVPIIAVTAEDLDPQPAGKAEVDVIACAYPQSLNTANVGKLLSALLGVLPPVRSGAQ